MSKVWFITGCSKGFGRALTNELLKSTDARVVATARNPEALKELQSEWGDRLLSLKLDVTDPSSIKAAVNAALKAFSHIDVLVNNAGYGLAGTLEECSMKDIRAIFETNVFGLIAVTQEILPLMREQRSGYILNLSSIAGLVSMPAMGIYNATKFAVEGLSEALADEVACFGIRVTLIEPGPFRTDFAGRSLIVAPENSAYKESAAVKTRLYIKEAHNTQPGDPLKAVKIMIQLVEMQHPPLRMLLGSRAIERLSEKRKIQDQEFAQYEDLTRSADYTLPS